MVPESVRNGIEYTTTISTTTFPNLVMGVPFLEVANSLTLVVEEPDDHENGKVIKVY